MGQRIQRLERRILVELTCHVQRCHVLHPDLVLSHHISHIHKVSVSTEVLNTSREEVEVHDVLLQVESVHRNDLLVGDCADLDADVHRVWSRVFGRQTLR